MKSELKLFAVKLSIFALLGVSLCLVIFLLEDKMLNYEFGNNVYFWGDSQMYRGLDLQVFKEKTGKNIRTAARHGAGVYDFLVFCDKVPSNSTVYISISKPVQIRDPAKDNNRTGFSIVAFKKLLENGYKFKDVLKIIDLNKVPKRIYKSTTELYSYSEKIVFSQPLSAFETTYSKIPSFIKQKQNLYLYGIEILKKKNSKITFIEFPYHSILSGIEKKSELKKYTDDFKNKVNSVIPFKTVNISLNSDKILMHDLTHLNEYGAELFSKEIIKQSNNYKGAVLFILNNGTCE